MNKLNYFFHQKKAYSDLFLRLIIGFHLIYGTQDNVFSSERMIEFELYLTSHSVPFPAFAAILSVYSQFICGLLIIIGFELRLPALIMIINFIAALLIAHIGDSYPSTFPALMMLMASFFFLPWWWKMLSRSLY